MVKRMAFVRNTHAMATDTNISPLATSIDGHIYIDYCIKPKIKEEWPGLNVPYQYKTIEYLSATAT